MESKNNRIEKILPFLYLGIGFEQDYDNEFSNMIEKSIEILSKKYSNDKEKFIGINYLCNEIKNGEMEKQRKLLEEEARMRKENKTKQNKVKKNKYENKFEEKKIIKNKELTIENTNEENINIKKTKNNQNINKPKSIVNSTEKGAYNNFIQIILDKIMSFENKEEAIENILNNKNNLELNINNKNEEEQNLKNKEKESKKIYQLPKHFHITTLFRGKKGFNKEEDAYKEFEENKETLINIYGIVIIPLKIIIYIIKTNEKSNNKIPHITAAINGEYKAKNSNDVMENIFGESKEYHEVYYKLMKGEKFDLSVKGNVYVLGKNEEFYFTIFKEPYQIKGKFEGFKA